MITAHALAHDPRRTCAHHPRCPEADSDRAVHAVAVAAHPEQGWHLLCNGVVRFDDGGAILPDGRTLEVARH